MKSKCLLTLAMCLLSSFLSAELTPVSLLEGKQPAYPPALKAEGGDGQVRVRAKIDATGKVVETSLVSATHEAFGESAIEAIRDWRFNPAVEDGIPVGQTIVIPIVFKLTFQDRINAIAGYEVFVDLEEQGVKVLGWSDVKRYFNVRGGASAREIPYPEALRGSGIKEEVVVQCVLSPQGRVLNPKLVDLKNRELAGPAIEHVVKLRFENPRLNGERVHVQQKVKLTCAE